MPHRNVCRRCAMALTKFTTVMSKTANVASVKLTVSVDRTGMKFDAALTYPTDNLSRGQHPLPPNPEPEPGRFWQEQSVEQMRTQMLANESDAERPTGTTGLLSPSSRVVEWPNATSKHGTAITTTKRRNRSSVVSVVRDCSGRDCQSPDSQHDKRNLRSGSKPTTTAGK